VLLKYSIITVLIPRDIRYVRNTEQHSGDGDLPVLVTQTTEYRHQTPENAADTQRHLATDVVQLGRQTCTRQSEFT